MSGWQLFARSCYLCPSEIEDLWHLRLFGWSGLSEEARFFDWFVPCDPCLSAQQIVDRFRLDEENRKKVRAKIQQHRQQRKRQVKQQQQQQQQFWQQEQQQQQQQRKQTFTVVKSQRNQCHQYKNQISLRQRSSLFRYMDTHA
jgi:hypothetical protein